VVTVPHIALQVVGTLELSDRDRWAALDHLLDTLPAQAAIQLLLGTEEVFQTLQGFPFFFDQKLDIDVMCDLDEWRNFMGTRLRQSTAGQFRKFDEDLDPDPITMRRLATWEADEAMRGGVSERHHPTTFLA
jgi:hypothetical protein